MSKSSHSGGFHRARVMAALAFGLAAFAPPATATPLVSQGTWIDTAYRSCSGLQACTAVFSPVPAFKTLIARSVTCHLYGPSTASYFYLVLAGNGQTIWLDPGTSIVSGSLRHYHFNLEIFDPFTTGQNPRVTYSVGTPVSSFGLYCSLSGELKP